MHLDHYNTAMRNLPELQNTLLLTCISEREDRTIISGKFDGKDAVFKFCYGENANAQIAAMQNEMIYHGTRMSTGDSRIPELFYANSDIGIAVMEQVPGTGLNRVMRDADIGQRRTLVSHAARWLQVYSGDRQRVSAFNAPSWIKKHRRLLCQYPDGEDRVRAEKLVKKMFEISKHLKNREFRQIRSHGDFCTLNLMFSDGIMYGVDLHNDSWLPVAKDAARFLVHLNIATPVKSDERKYGLPSGDLNEFIEKFELLDGADFQLPFFVAFELAGRLLNERHHIRNYKNTRNLIDWYLAEEP